LLCEKKSQDSLYVRFAPKHFLSIFYMHIM